MAAGRPTKYNKNQAKLAYWMARNGLTDEEMAENLKIATSTLYAWKEKYPEFSEAIKEGKELPDDLVVQSLYKRATGFEYEERKVIANPGAGGEQVQRVEVTHKLVIPDVAACIFWLKNRRPQEWRDTQKFEHSGPGGKPIQVAEKRAEDYENTLTRLAEVLEGSDPGEPVHPALPDGQTG